MKTKLALKLIVLDLLLSALCLPAFAQGTAFTYQGQLTDGGNPANGTYDLTFNTYDNLVSGSQQGPTVTNSPTSVSNGLFSVTLDFGANVFTGPARWLEIGVRTNGGTLFQTLAPRQPLTPTPYAITANSASNLLGKLPATQLGAGTAGINISGSASSVTGGFAGDVTGTQSATVVGKVSGVTAANVAAGVNAANAASSADIVSTIVRRDSGGNFSAGSVILASNLYLPFTTTNSGIIYSGDETLMQSFGGNLSVGMGAGNLTASTFANTALGNVALHNNISGDYNTALGYTALSNNTNGQSNVALGADTMLDNQSGGYNTAVGTSALFGNTGGNQNTAIGYEALNNCQTGNDNIACGYQALYYVSTGSGNIGIGQGVLPNLQTGSGNIAIGVNAGNAIYTGSNNIDIGNTGFGDESGVIRIGTVGTHTKAVMNGIFGTTVNSGAPVYVNANGLLGTATSSRRFKQNIQSMAGASDVLLALHPVTFQYKPDLDPDGVPQFGLIAEEVEMVDPALVLHDDKHQIYTVRYEAVNAMLLNEFLKEHRKIEEQHTEIRDLQQSVDELKDLVKQLAAQK